MWIVRLVNFVLCLMLSASVRFLCLILIPPGWTLSRHDNICCGRYLSSVGNTGEREAFIIILMLSSTFFLRSLTIAILSTSHFPGSLRWAWDSSLSHFFLQVICSSEWALWWPRESSTSPALGTACCWRSDLELSVDTRRERYWPGGLPS